MAEQPTITIPKDIIEPIIQARVAEAVAQALGGHQRIVEEAVRVALEQKVDDKGSPTNYSSNQNFLQWLVRDAIRQSASKAVREQIAGMADSISKTVASQLKRQSNYVAKNIAEGVVKAAADASRLLVKVSVDGIEVKPPSPY